MKITRPITLALLASFTLQLTAFADVTLIGSASIPGTAPDLSRLKGNITTNAGADTGIPNAIFGGAGSAIDYTGTDNVYLMAPDRGPGNGDAHFADRVHYVSIVVQPNSLTPVTVSLVQTTLLTNPSGRAYTGSATTLTASSGRSKLEALRLDPEGIRLAHDSATPGAFWISDEYGPYILKFDRNGHNIDSFALPAKYACPMPSADAEKELVNATGRQPNRGMEGLALSPDGKTLIGLMQNALIQDHALDADHKRSSAFTRLVTMTLADGTLHEYAYPLDSKTLGTNEILAVNDHQFLAIERDGKAGKESAAKKIYLIDIAGATDISKPFTLDGTTYDYSGTSAANGLPVAGPVAGVHLISKSLFLDVLDPKLGLLGDNLPEKFEGLAWGPDFANGDKLLIITSDNDFKPAEPTYFYAFRVSAAPITASR